MIEYISDRLVYYRERGESVKREEKNAQSRQRIIDAALREFSSKGYDAASVNTLCAEKDISKGIIYHYFKDKNELYLMLVTDCFDRLTDYLRAAESSPAHAVEQRLQGYFDARLRFFAENPLYLGIFFNAVLNPPAQLTAEIAAAREEFDALNIATMTDLLKSVPLRRDVTVSAVVEDFRLYMDYFNARFQAVLAKAPTPEKALHDHEEQCHRQIRILLYGVVEEKHD